MLRGLVVSNGIGGEAAYPSDDRIQFDIVQIDEYFRFSLDGYDLLVTPNGIDHVALFRKRQAIAAFLQAGNALLCCCGWFLDWVPGNRWIHDNSHPTREMRHSIGVDLHRLLRGVDLSQLDHNRHGISGWWACGYIEPAESANVLIQDTWGRAIVVLDSNSTGGTMLLTASGPLGDYSRYGVEAGPTQVLYQNFVDYLARRRVN
ncbi:MAG: hypothetical protein R3C05_19800 [Pirellulaceae bacterium]